MKNKSLLFFKYLKKQKKKMKVYILKDNRKIMRVKIFQIFEFQYNFIYEITNKSNFKVIKT